MGVDRITFELVVDGVPRVVTFVEPTKIADLLDATEGLGAWLGAIAGDGRPAEPRPARCGRCREPVDAEAQDWFLPSHDPLRGWVLLRFCPACVDYVARWVDRLGAPDS